MIFKILVMSCDKNEDLWKPFHILMEKYWKNHPQIIYSTETKQNPYYTTICRDLPIEKWTKRLWDTARQIDSKFILLMCDDVFIRDYVNQTLIEVLCGYLQNYGGLNMEKTFDKNDIPFTDKLMIRNPNGKYKTSVMCQLFRKNVLLELTQNLEINPWEYEKLNNGRYYSFIVSKHGDFINWGYGNHTWFGIQKGKWCRECKEFFDKENIEVDYSIRGFID